MKLRGLRTINIICLILCIISMIFTIIIICVISIIHTFIVYNNFVKSYPFSTVPFWKDNRTINKNPLIPLLKIEDVNLSNFTIVIASCCRNVKKNLVGFQRNVHAITALFGDYRIYLGESDSHDETLKFLNEWRKNDLDHIRVYSKGQQRWQVPSREFLCK
ncbi:unnamed protein product [Rotaria sp. Silwood1]|nr:unnamed protein product [Rotaria sp. Silwood1]